MRQLITSRELPPYSAMYMMGDSRLRVVTSYPGDSVVTVLVFEAEATRPSILITVPIEMYLLQLGDGYLIGRRMNKLGVPEMVLA